MSSIKVDEVSMHYNLASGGSIHALEKVTLDIKGGELVSVLGPSGCGKTTLLNIIAGFLAPSSGQTLIDGRRILGPGPDRGMVFQQGALFEWMSVQKNVSFGPDMAGQPREKTARVVRDLLNVVGLSGFENKPVYQLSGGMQQRVALARCLANDPGVILMDEPLGALDALTRERMQSLVLKLWKETGKSIMLITHSVEEALLLGERLIIMAPRPGRIIKEYRLPFADAALTQDARSVKASADFVRMREEVLSMIWSMEEEIMGPQSGQEIADA